MNGRIKKIDFLLTIGCIVFLIAALGSVGKQGQEISKRIVCAVNQGQILKGMINYANENEGRMPSAGSGYWPCDGEYNMVNEILESMGINISAFVLQPGMYDPIPVQSVFYCPTNYSQTKGRDTNWSYCIYVYNSQVAGYRFLGYAFLCSAQWNGYGSRPIRGGMKETDPPDPTKKWVYSIFIENPSETELIVDTIMSERKNMLTGEVYDLNQYPNGNFGQITSGGNPQVYGFYDSSSHLKTSREPYGGNIGFVDGHVKWRNFKDMRNRITLYRLMWWW
jgi:prepilin-type processing-associated H-X9-DG protein